MSTASRVTLGLAVSVSTAIIGYVHYKQSADRLRLHDGVLRDVEQQQRRKHENTYALQQQIDITKQLKARQASSNSSDTPDPASTNPAQSNLQAEQPAVQHEGEAFGGVSQSGTTNRDGSPPTDIA
ncbi:protein PET117 homolog, mitochondrial [Drosophila teissieri]|uniref:protein PET117 homolog, mitochondrial n=1 Tax=Drosophila teissieri TaxID=7243 RepID=UPI001CBA4B0B|nr:protein PET117 homolog, mitochondrial [Drosophila teissieri]